MIPTGKKQGKHTGRVAVRTSVNFRVGQVPHRYCTLLQAADGYEYRRSRCLPPRRKQRGFRHPKRYEQGQLEGMVKGKKMFCVTTRGGDYSPTSPAHGYDFQEPYLRAIFGMVGIVDQTFINVQPMDVSPELREAKIIGAMQSIDSLMVGLDFPYPPLPLLKISVIESPLIHVEKG